MKKLSILFAFLAVAFALTTAFTTAKQTVTKFKVHDVRSLTIDQVNGPSFSTYLASMGAEALVGPESGSDINLASGSYQEGENTIFYNALCDEASEFVCIIELKWEGEDEPSLQPVEAREYFTGDFVE